MSLKTLAFFYASTGLATAVTTPEMVLPDNINEKIFIDPNTNKKIELRKGTIAATLYNISALNKLLNRYNDLNASEKNELENIEKITKELIPALAFIGLFQLFTIEEWLKTEEQPGRIFVALLYLEQNPTAINESVKAELEKIKQSTKIAIIAEKIGKLISA